MCVLQFFFPLWLISSLIFLWWEKMLDMISTFLNLLRIDLWDHKSIEMWSILENVLSALERRVYSFAFGWNVLKISTRSIWPNVAFKACVFLIFCFDELFIGVSGILKSILLCYCQFLLLCVCLPYALRGSYVGCINICHCHVFLYWSLCSVLPYLL